MSSELDPELQNLLDEVAKAQPKKEDLIVPVVASKEEILTVVDSPVDPPVPLPSSVDVEAFDKALSDKEQKVVSPTIETFVLEKEDPRLEGIKNSLFKLMEHVSSNADKQIDEFDEDRKKADEILNILITKLHSDQDIKSAEIQTIAMVLQTKTDITANRSGFIDSIAKMLASLKKNDSLVPIDSSKTMSHSDVLKALHAPTNDP